VSSSDALTRPAPGLRAVIEYFLTQQTQEFAMTSNPMFRIRPMIDALEHRESPASLAVKPFDWLDQPPQFLLAAQSLNNGSAAQQSRPFHLEESGTAVINGPIAVGTTINASASGHATHLGAFTLNDTSTIVAIEGPVLHVVGHAELEAANGDVLNASFTGTVNLATGEGTLTFEWISGGTGRFANASGTTQWHVQLNPDLTYSAVADGVINY
jgi:hypothetical protein